MTPTKSHKLNHNWYLSFTNKKIPNPTTEIKRPQKITTINLADRGRITNKKTITQAITQLKGWGRNRAINLCHQLGLLPDTKLRDLDPIKQTQLRRHLIKNQKILVNTNFRKKKLNLILRWIETKHQKAYRLLCGLPLRGQRTKTNRYSARKNARKWVSHLRSLAKTKKSKL